MNEIVKGQPQGRHIGVRYEAGEQDQRPWGNWVVVATGPNYTVKRIEVLPGKRLSLQYHEFRTEHWTVVQGEGEVQIDEDLRTVAAGDHVFIPLRAPHRIAAKGSQSLVFLEVQMGDLLDENDIIRLVDDFGRI